MNQTIETQLTSRQLEIIWSYQDHSETETGPTTDLFETGFEFPGVELPEHGRIQISPAELAEIRSSEPISPEFQGQPDLTVSELSQAASELLASAAWNKLYEDSVASTQDTDELAKDLERFYRVYARLAKYQGIALPLLDANIRQVVETIFTRLPKYNAESVYSILAANKAYGLFHRFCTQSFPLGQESVLVDTKRKRSFARSIMATFLPPRIRNLKTQLSKIGAKNLSQETQWRAIDQETRINLAQEMFAHVKQYLSNHPTEKVIILEPGGGNAELSALLGEAIANDEITRSKAMIIVREYSQDMINEGRTKVTMANQNTSQSLPIEFIAGSAETPVRDQLSKLKMAAENGDAETLNSFGLSPQQATRLLDFVQGAKIIGGISTYAAGAMSNSDGPDTITTRIYSQLVDEVDGQNGLVIINDFSAPPPIELLTDSRFNVVDQDKLIYLQSVAQSFTETGLSHGLATAYGLWGEGIGHDDRQIWQTYLRLTEEQAPGLEFDTILHPFSLLPIPLHGRYLSIPGFMETTLRCRGRSQNSQLEL